MLLQLALLHSFLWLSYTSLCIGTTSSLSIPVNWHLGCFHVLAIVNSAAIRMHASFLISQVMFKRITIVLSFPGWWRIICSCTLKFKRMHDLLCHKLKWKCACIFLSSFSFVFGTDIQTDCCISHHIPEWCPLKPLFFPFGSSQLLPGSSAQTEKTSRPQIVIFPSSLAVHVC